MYTTQAARAVIVSHGVTAIGVLVAQHSEANHSTARGTPDIMPSTTSTSTNAAAPPSTPNTSMLLLFAEEADCPVSLIWCGSGAPPPPLGGWSMLSEMRWHYLHYLH